MSVIARIEKFLFESDLWKFLLAIGVITLFKTGIWAIPNLERYRLIAQDPFVNPFTDPNQHYLVWSWLGPFLAWLIGATGKWEFFAFHLFFTLAFTALYVKTAFTVFSSDTARISVILFSLLPVSATAYFWVSHDSLTLFLMILGLAFPRYLAFTFLVGFLIGVQHFEQGFFSAAALLFAITLSKMQGHVLVYSVKFCAALLAGAISGKILLFVLFDHYDIVVNSGRIYWLKEHFHILLNDFFFHFHYIVWSVLGLGWLVALRYTDWGARSIPFFLTLAGLCLLLPVSADQTRVLAIVTFPLVSAYWLLNKDFLEKLRRPEATLLFTAWAIMPWSWVWEGIPRWSTLPFNVAVVLNKLFGWFYVPDDLLPWPFLNS